MLLSIEQETLSVLEKEGFIQRFGYTHELAWNTMKDFLYYSGVTENTIGFRGTTR